MSDYKPRTLREVMVLYTFGAVCVFIFLGFLVYANKIDKEYKVPEQYIIYDLRSTDTLVVGQVTSKYEINGAYFARIDNKDYNLTQEQYSFVDVGDKVLSAVKEK